MRGQPSNDTSYFGNILIGAGGLILAASILFGMYFTLEVLGSYGRNVELDAAYLMISAIAFFGGIICMVQGQLLKILNHIQGNTWQTQELMKDPITSAD